MQVFPNDFQQFERRLSEAHVFCCFLSPSFFFQILPFCLLTFLPCSNWNVNGSVPVNVHVNKKKKLVFRLKMKIINEKMKPQPRPVGSGSLLEINLLKVYETITNMQWGPPPFSMSRNHVVEPILDLDQWSQSRYLQIGVSFTFCIKSVIE